MAIKVLAVDTATRSCSVALCRESELVAELYANTGETHSRHVLRMIDTVIQLSGVGQAEIDAYAVTNGPGSFTGLRIGLSVVKAMALVHQKPVLGISTLDVLARQCPYENGPIFAMIDARRSEVYFAGYEEQNSRLVRTVGPSVAAVENVLDDITGAAAFIGSGAMLYQTQITAKLGKTAFFPPIEQHRIRAANVAMMGAKQLHEETIFQPQNVVPRYIRPSDAELNKKKSLKTPN